MIQNLPTKFVGTVAADEPRAALVARDVLDAGGYAADAAVAGVFAMAVTYPAAVSLGAGGVCLAADAEHLKIDAISFPLRLPPGGGAVPIPALVRGMALLHGAYGRLRWEQVVIPAEQLARFGDPTSRALVQAVQETQPPVTQSPELGLLLGRLGGGVRGEGEAIANPTLANVFSRLRSAGPHDFYQGLTAQILLADIAQAGGAITAEDLRGYTAQTSKPIELEFRNRIKLYFTPEARGGAIAAWLMEQGFSGGSGTFGIGGGNARPAALAAAIGQAYMGLEAGAPMFEHGSASISVMDRYGRTAACAVGLSRPFGARRVGQLTNVLFAATPGQNGDEMPYLSAMAAIHPTGRQAFATAAASGGAPAPAALAQALLTGLVPERMLAAEALARPRVFQPAPTAPLLYEPGADQAMMADIVKRGVALAEVRRLGRLTLSLCSQGSPGAPTSCRAAADRRGFGLAVGDEH
ncbi:gamma-glutamyltransferase [Ferrovibrio sp.]|uniref:gamma-glutamyltransferase n=1 Tax=Ferrovibrio sp. TaxID=1917215 RepID=UPI0035B1196A